MKKILSEEKIPLIILFGLFILTFICTWARCGSLIIDCGREAYIPYAIANGKTLYKDIFCIYGAFPYLFNAFLFKIFQPNLSILYLTGGFLGLVYLFGVYLVSREFLAKSVSVMICVLIMYVAIFNCTAFNFIYPYSFAMIWACVFSIWILYFLIKYLQTKNAKFMYASAFMWGGICVSKIDFVPLILVILPLFIVFEPDIKKRLPGFIGFTLILPFITYLVLFTQGADFGDFAKNSHYIHQMIKSTSLHFFYSLYHIATFKLDYYLAAAANFIGLSLLSAVFFMAILYCFRRRNKLAKYGGSVFLTLFFFQLYCLYPAPKEVSFSFLPSFCTGVLIWLVYEYIRSKNYKNTKKLCLITLFSFAILGSIKTYFNLILFVYGTFYFAPLLIALVWFIHYLLENNLLYNTKKQYNAAICIFLGIFSLIYLINTIFVINTNNEPIKTSMGMHISNPQLVKPTRELIEYLEKNSKKDDDVVIFPEGIIVNFLAQKDWKFYQTSFIPLDFDTFGEDAIIKELHKKKPTYVAFSTRDLREYNMRVICTDFARALCTDVVTNYNFEAAFGEKFRIYLFKLKDDKTKGERLE